MKIFITGATSYIGFNVALALRRAGHAVWGLVRSEDKAPCWLDRRSYQSWKAAQQA